MLCWATGWMRSTRGHASSVPHNRSISICLIVLVPFLCHRQSLPCPATRAEPWGLQSRMLPSEVLIKTRAHSPLQTSQCTHSLMCAAVGVWHGGMSGGARLSSLLLPLNPCPCKRNIFPQLPSFQVLFSTTEGHTCAWLLRQWVPFPIHVGNPSILPHSNSLLFPPHLALMVL